MRPRLPFNEAATDRLRKAKLAVLEPLKRDCSARQGMELSAKPNERIQVCVSDLRPAHRRGFQHERWATDLPDLLSQDRRAASAHFGRIEVCSFGSRGVQAPPHHR